MFLFGEIHGDKVDEELMSTDQRGNFAGKQKER